MRTSTLNISIVAENALVVNGLRHYLQNQFGASVRISCYYDFKSCLKNAKTADVIVVDPVLDGKKGNDVLRSVKLINPNVIGFVHTTGGEVAAGIHSLAVGKAKVAGAPYFSTVISTGFTTH